MKAIEMMVAINKAMHKDSRAERLEVIVSHSGNWRGGNVYSIGNALGDIKYEGHRWGVRGSVRDLYNVIVKGVLKHE